MLSNPPTSVGLGGARGIRNEGFIPHLHADLEILQPTDVGGFGGSEGNLN